MAQDMNTGTMSRATEGRQMEGGQAENRRMTDRQPGSVAQAGGDSPHRDVAQQEGGQASAREETRAMLPRCDVLEDSQGITLLADLPGVPRDRLELRVDGETLLIEGAVSTALPEQMEPTYVEVRVPRFRRAFTLSRELDTEKIEANLTDGVLRLRIPKKAHAQPRKIAVQPS
jgi:HSP20 family molecular chaperone IbpA